MKKKQLKKLLKAATAALESKALLQPAPATAAVPVVAAGITLNSWIDTYEKILGDIHPLALLAFDSTANSVATQINFQTDISDGAYARYQYAWCLGRDGVIYVTGIDDDAGGPKYLYASADDGASWQVLSFNAPGKTPGGESLWASGPSGRLFIGEGSWRYTSVPDYTRAQLKRRFSV